MGERLSLGPLSVAVNPVTGKDPSLTKYDPVQLRHFDAQRFDPLSQLRSLSRESAIMFQDDEAFRLHQAR